MVLARHLALLLALAIATIATSLVPSSAQAHDGHQHAASLSSAAPTATEFAVVKPADVTSIQAKAGTDCCGPFCPAGGHHGSCCFAPGLPPTNVSAELPPLTSTRAAARESASLVGIAPEAIPEPPRPFA